MTNPVPDITGFKTENGDIYRFHTEGAHTALMHHECCVKGASTYRPLWKTYQQEYYHPEDIEIIKKIQSLRLDKNILLHRRCRSKTPDTTDYYKFDGGLYCTIKTPSKTPQVGLVPVEYFHPDARIHIGTMIVELNPDFKD